VNTGPQLPRPVPVANSSARIRPKRNTSSACCSARLAPAVVAPVAAPRRDERFDVKRATKEVTAVSDSSSSEVEEESEELLLLKSLPLLPLLLVLR